MDAGPMNDLDDLRYPIGKFIPPATSFASTRGLHIQTLRDLPQELTSAIAGLSEEQLDTSYREGGWTVRQVVHHVADSHANSYIRFKLALTEDWPTIKPYDEAAWANLADSRTMELPPSLAFISSLHARWVALLETLSEEHFHRGFNHPERGRQNLATTLALYAWHSRHHTAHITQLRARMRW